MSVTYAPDALNGTIDAGVSSAKIPLTGRTWAITVEARLYSASAFEWALDDGQGEPDGPWIPVLAGAPFAIPLRDAPAKILTRNRLGTVYWTLLGSKTPYAPI